MKNNSIYFYGLRLNKPEMERLKLLADIAGLSRARVVSSLILGVPIAASMDVKIIREQLEIIEAAGNAKTQ